MGAASGPTTCTAVIAAIANSRRLMLFIYAWCRAQLIWQETKMNWRQALLKSESLVIPSSTPAWSVGKKTTSRQKIGGTL
jgi:hypothetical protein